VRGVIQELETRLKFKENRESDAGFMLKRTPQSLELEVVDQGVRPNNWQLKEGIMVINSEKPTELIPILAELGFDEVSKGSLIFKHRDYTATPPFKLVEGPSANWHIGIHFDTVPSFVEFKAEFKKQKPALAPIVGTPLTQARHKQHCCISCVPVHGLVIEITTGVWGFIAHGPARSDLARKCLKEWSPYSHDSK
jgi:hypothetical protein